MGRKIDISNLTYNQRLHVMADLLDYCITEIEQYGDKNELNRLRVIENRLTSLIEMYEG